METPQPEPKENEEIIEELLDDMRYGIGGG